MDNLEKGLFIGGIIIVIGLFGAIYYGNCREAKVFNQKYQTTYSCGDFFWAKDQINTQVQIINIEGLIK